MTYSGELSRTAFQPEQDAQEANLPFASRNGEESNHTPRARARRQNADPAVFGKRRLNVLSDPLLPRWPLGPEP